MVGALVFIGGMLFIELFAWAIAQEKIEMDRVTIYFKEPVEPGAKKSDSGILCHHDADGIKISEINGDKERWYPITNVSSMTYDGKTYR